MNDNELKNILKNSSNVPKAPSDEWSKILRGIEHSKESNFSFSKVFGLALATLAIVVVFSLQYDSSSTDFVEQNEIEAYLLEDLYFDESDGFYAYFN